MTFQFTPLREGRPLRRAFLFFPFVFQFTPLREGRHAGVVVLGQRRDISIHAPPRGATRAAGGSGSHSGNFNSRPSARGDGTLRNQLPGSPFYFNSRPSARGDRFPRRKEGMTMISIHAPPRGATRAADCSSVFAHKFQFTPLREGRRQKICNFCKSFVQPLQISMA